MKQSKIGQLKVGTIVKVNPKSDKSWKIIAVNSNKVYAEPVNGQGQYTFALENKVYFDPAQPSYYGEYNAYGYAICQHVKDSTGEWDKTIYSAGNSYFDSAVYLVPGEDTVPADTLKKWCENTGASLALENGAIWQDAQLDKSDSAPI